MLTLGTIHPATTNISFFSILQHREMRDCRISKWDRNLNFPLGCFQKEFIVIDNELRILETWACIMVAWRLILALERILALDYDGPNQTWIIGMLASD